MDLKLSDFLYDLPNERIATHPAVNREDAKLLFYDQGAITHHSFRDIPSLLPEDSLIVFNDTRVIPARILLKKETGAKIEIFLLEPLLPSTVHEEMMATKNTCTWKCLIGNAKKWKPDTTLHHETLSLQAVRAGEDEVTFKWENDQAFSDLLHEIGKIPLPPYISREVNEEDRNRYQTVYAKMDGAVAAPTAGLHFTNEVLTRIRNKDIRTDYLTLHVSAGTFQPIKSEQINEHQMHNEQVWITRSHIENLLNARKVIAVGTTAMRTLESIYWFGVKLVNGHTDFFIRKEDPYQLKAIPGKDALRAVIERMDKKNLDRLGGQTEIFIYPGYPFSICDGLVTNYHLPGSTLILLVAAFIGKDWRKVYQEALEHDYRFLSYGDSSLLMRPHMQGR